MGTPRRRLAAAPPAEAHEADQVLTIVPERHLYKIPEAMVLLSMSRTVIYEQIRAGRLRSVCQGRTRLIPAIAIDEYVSLLLAESEVSYGQSA